MAIAIAIVEGCAEAQDACPFQVPEPRLCTAVHGKPSPPRAVSGQAQNFVNLRPFGTVPVAAASWLHFPGHQPE
jgi:hypothetical protein